MDSDPGLISYWHESYEGNLFIKRADVTKAALNISLLLGRTPLLETVPDKTARNVVLGMVDAYNESHTLFLGGVAVDPNLGFTFWSSPYTEHSQLVTAGKRASILVGHTHEPSTSLRLKEMTITEVAPEDTAAYLDQLNTSRAKHQLHTRELDEFQDTEAPKTLYVAAPSENPAMNTIPVSAYKQGSDGLVWMRSVAYPISAAEIFPAA